MGPTSKGKSPFYPGQPVPLELFVGRRDLIDRIMTRGAMQVAQGKPVALYVQGEYGIGKSSLAGYVQALAEKQQGLHGIYASMGGVKDLTELAVAVMEATLRSGALAPGRADKIRTWLAKYIGKPEFFGFSYDVGALRQDAPSFSTHIGMLGFLSEVKARLEETGVKGLFLVLDEINGISANPQFAYFIKGLVDTNAMAQPPVPLLLMLCGVEERRGEMIRHHPPIDRIFDVVDTEPLNDAETGEFFSKAFESVQMKASPEALEILIRYSAGFPKIMHLIGDAVYWSDADGIVNADDALTGTLRAAEEVGRKYVDQQVYKALRSKDYHSILKKIGKLGGPGALAFTKSSVASGLSDSEKRKFNNFLPRMKRLSVIRAGDVPGEYVFTHRMVQLYIWLSSFDNSAAKA
jgi:hypothetical protein